MDTSSSVEVLDSDEIRRRAGLETTSDILAIVPNLVSTETSNFAPAVRGADGTGPAQGADAFFAGTRPRLNYQVDGRTLSYNESIFSDATLWDVERVEIFRGPQSTLQGRNAVAGAIVVKTRDPAWEFETGARVLAGNYDTRQYSAYVSGPIVDEQAAFRIAVDHRTAEDFVNFEQFPGVSRPDEYKSLAVRGKLLFEPDALPDFKALLTLNHADLHGPQGNEVNRPFDEHHPAFARMPRFGTRTDGAILDADWQLGDDFALDLLVSGTDIEVTREADPGTGNSEIDTTEFVVEPRLHFDLFDGILTGFLGTHHFRSNQDEFTDLFGGGTFDDETTTDAVFGEATWAFADTLDLTLGGRWEREHRERNGGVGPFVIDFDETYEVFLPKATLAWHPSDDLTLGATVARGYNGGSAGFTFEPPFVSYTYDEEYVWNYELFGRASLLDGRLFLSANAFYSDYKDMQLPFDLNPDPAVWSFVVRNAPGAESYGLELGSRFLLTDELELFANAGLLETEVTDFAGSGIEGHELPRSPSASVNFGAFYTHRSGFEAGFDARWSDRYHTDVINEPRARIDPYWVVNAQVAWRFSRVRVHAAVTNLFDNVEPVLLYPGTTPDLDTATLLMPRMVTVGVTVDL
jgi:outer membrane receptor protein involved in Fe transport